MITIMRPTLVLGFLAAVAVGATIDTPARADGEFDVTAGSGQITVTAHAGWHVNKDYPWKLVVGDTKLSKSSFSFAETTATVTGAPAGTGKLKGAVCSADTCHPFEKEVVIK
jgi:hypothetical protein